jgi:hypothetical protein
VKLLVNLSKSCENRALDFGSNGARIHRVGQASVLLYTNHN